MKKLLVLCAVLSGCSFYTDATLDSNFKAVGDGFKRVIDQNVDLNNRLQVVEKKIGVSPKAAPGHTPTPSTGK